MEKITLYIMKYEVDLEEKIVTFKNYTPAYKEQRETLEKIFTKNKYSIINDLDVHIDKPDIEWEESGKTTINPLITYTGTTGGLTIGTTSGNVITYSDGPPAIDRNYI